MQYNVREKKEREDFEASMKISGRYSIKAPVQKVWEALLDPTTLAHCMPGCEKLEPVAENEYQATLIVGVGPVKGTYKATITLSDLTPPSSYKLVVDGTGVTGFVRGEGFLTLTEESGATRIIVDGEAQIGGPIATVGQRLAGTVNKMMMDRFFRCIGRSVR